MLVSVIIPVYNVAQYLQEALDSIIHQTYPNIEIIIIDDGSTDGSGEICDEYAGRDSRIRVIHQENKGLSAARNAGLDTMGGDMVAFLDPDDAYCPEFIEAMTDSMIRENADMAVCKYTIYRTTEYMPEAGTEKPKPTIQPGTYKRNGALRALADRQLNHSVWNKIYRRNIWDGIRFPEGHVFEDINVTFQLIDRCQRMYVLDQPQYKYRKRPGSICSIKSPESTADFFAAFFSFEEYIRTHIPEVFSEEHLERFRQKILTLQIKKYIFFSRCSEPDAKEFSNKLRKQIVEARKKMNIRKCSRRIRMCYQMFCWSPVILVGAYSTYLFIHSKVHRQ